MKKHFLVICFIVLSLIILVESVLAQSFIGVDRVINSAISEKTFPGASIIVGTDSSILHHRAFGYHTYDSASKTTDTTTIFDLASLTKVIATVSCIMHLYEEGKVDLYAYVASYLPAFAQNGKERVKIINLLLHNSGLKPYHSPSANESPQEIIDFIFSLPLQYPTGSKTVYSCLNFVTLGKVVEAVTGKSIDQYLRQILLDPLGLYHTMYNPPDSLKSRCMPTGTNLQGRVHDPLAAGLGGISGNAGLFSTTYDLAKLAQLYLNKGIHQGTQFFQEETIRLFTTRYDPGGSIYALGWRTKSPTRSSAGNYFSPNSFGHTGFTGTSIWIDPERKIFVIFLTNRGYAGGTGSISRVRAKVHDAVIKNRKQGQEKQGQIPIN